MKISRDQRSWLMWLANNKTSIEVIDQMTPSRSSTRGYTGFLFLKDSFACVISHFSHVQLLAAVQTAAHQDPLSMGFSKQEYQSGLPFPSPGDIPDPGIQSMPPAWQVDSLLLSHLGSLTREAVPPTSALPAREGRNPYY